MNYLYCIEVICMKKTNIVDSFSISILQLSIQFRLESVHCSLCVYFQGLLRHITAWGMKENTFATELHCKVFHGKFFLCNFFHFNIPTMIFTEKDFESNHVKIYENYQ